LYRETDELAEIVGFLESKSEVNPKEIALAKRKEMKKKGEIKSPGKKKGRKGGVFAENDIMKYKSNTHPVFVGHLNKFQGACFYQCLPFKSNRKFVTAEEYCALK